MAKEYLTENAVFTCSLGLGPVIITCSEPANTKVYYKGKKLLTNAAILKSKAGICQPLTQAAQRVPQPCQCQLSVWRSFSDKEFACASFLLNKSSYNQCFRGGATGKITVRTTGVAGHVIKAEVHSTTLIPKATVQSLALFTEKQNAKETDNAASRNLKNENKTKRVVASEKPDFSNRLCPGCEKYQSCSYYNADTTIDNDSAKLRANYELLPECERDLNYELMVKPYGEVGLNPWFYAAHHIISGNQVLKDEEFIELVRMANSLWDVNDPASKIYDINNAQNCIFLVSKDNEYGEQNRTGKTVSAYDAMSESGVQWHLGGHSYQFDKDEVDFLVKRVKFLTHRSEAVELKNYATLLKEELRKVKASMFSNKVCRDTDSQKRAFVKRMNHISLNVKSKLMAFQEKPHHSFPYYVSKVAYQFAFGLPRTAKIVLVYKAGNKIVLEKYRVTRFNDTITEGWKTLDFKTIKPSVGSNPSFFELKTNEDKAGIIQFCENIEFFILDDGLKKEILPFHIELGFALEPENWEKTGKRIEWLEDHSTEILVWLRDCQNSYQYTAPLKKIRERLKECNL